MKKIFAGLIVTLLITGLAVLPSCQDRAAKKMQTQKEKETVGELQNEIEENVYPLPTSAEVIKMLTDLEVGFTFGITNPTENVKKYFQHPSKAINLGVYGADLSYVTLYNMNQEVLNYLEVIQQLAAELNMSQVYDRTFYDSIKVNFDKRDKLVDLLTEKFNDTYNFLRRNDQQALALLVVGGAWVEGMYLTTHVTEVSYNSPGFSKVLLDQKDSFNTYMEITQPYLSNPALSDFIRKLDPIKNIYAGLGTSLTEQNIKEIKTAMVGIRSQVVQ
jgi:hypothetical protein